MSEIPRSGVTKARSSLRADLSLIPEKFDEFSIDHSSIDGDVFRLALHGLKTLDEQHQLLACVGGLRTGACD